MIELLRKIFGGKGQKEETRKNSITGRNQTFPVPYLSRLDGLQLLPGQSLIIRGIVCASELNPGHEQVLINLTGGPKVEKEGEDDELDDRLLSLRADLRKRRIHINACVQGQWGKEGIVKKGWKTGEEFHIRVRCHDQEFGIYLDHKLVAKFAHYVPISHITHLYINGDVALYGVSWEGKYYQVPYTADIPGNFYPQRKLFFSGFLKKKAKQITVDLFADKDIALRIQSRIGERKVIRNTRTDSNWGQDEADILCSFPLKRGKEFDMIIFCGDTEFQIYVNDVFVCNYAHRLPSPSINRVNIEGDLEVHGVHLK
ncbi:unnamed protein product, partial [Mesorhabditis belari]|uniref:Galectin n=1 Tax=Mesorhabditis belari TaxID=2138241 RepID=A0AAF3F3S8_9BILA